MDYKVIDQFIDRSTNEYYSIGSLYKTKSEKRAKELVELGYLEAPQLPPLTKVKANEDK